MPLQCANRHFNSKSISSSWTASHQCSLPEERSESYAHKTQKIMSGTKWQESKSKDLKRFITNLASKCRKKFLGELSVDTKILQSPLASYNTVVLHFCKLVKIVISVCIKADAYPGLLSWIEWAQVCLLSSELLMQRSWRNPLLPSDAEPHLEFPTQSIKEVVDRAFTHGLLTIPCILWIGQCVQPLAHCFPASVAIWAFHSLGYTHWDVLFSWPTNGAPGAFRESRVPHPWKQPGASFLNEKSNMTVPFLPASPLCSSTTAGSMSSNAASMQAILPALSK